MVLTVLVNKLRSFFLFFVAIFRRALCCLQRRRRVSFDEPLTNIGIGSSQKNDQEIQPWNDWGDGMHPNSKPNTVQEHIEFYRQQKAQLQNPVEAVEEPANFFEDMTPKITKQKKIFISADQESEPNSSVNLSLLQPDALSLSNELGEWDENPGGWEGEQQDWDALEIIKQKKRQERERKAFEQQQRRMERANKTYGKVNS